MIRKHDDLAIEPTNPFVHDRLERQKNVEILTNLIGSIRQPFVLSVEAPWGWGKTTFLRMWKAHLDQLSHPSLYYNAWATDYAEDPLIPLISELSSQVAHLSQHARNPSQVAKSLAQVRRQAGRIVRRTVPLAIQLATKGLLGAKSIADAAMLIKDSSSDIAEFVSELAKERLERFEAQRKSVDAFRGGLKDLAGQIIEAESQFPIAIFIDELDRCRPDYAISLLERIKHLFSVPGIVFVLGLDPDQLRHSIRATYGQDMDAGGYLKRFIDLNFRLPTPPIDGFCKFLFERFDLEQAISTRSGGPDDGRSLLEHFTELARAYRMSLRQIEHCFTQLNLVVRTTGPRFHLYPPILAFLVALKSHRPDLYAQIRDGSHAHSLDDLVGAVTDDSGLASEIDSWLKEQVESFMLAAFLPEGEIEGRLASLRAETNHADAPKRRRALAIIEVLQRGIRSGDRRAIPYLVERIELTRDFTSELPSP